MTRGALVGAVCCAIAVVSAPPARAASPATTNRSPAERALEGLETRYARLLTERRPDLAERYYGATPYDVRFTPLDEATLDAHLRMLERLLAEAGSLPAGPRADSLRARLGREITQSAPGGALRRDPLLWLDVVDAAARAPFAFGSATGCDRTHRATLQLRTLPEALRGATVLLRGAKAPDAAALEDRIARLERLLRQDLPARSEPCRDSRRRGEFVEADSLAAAFLAEFRRWLSPGR